MGALGPKERATYSIAADIKSRLDSAIPKSERSSYVEQAIDRALREDARQRFRKFLDEIPKSTGGENSTDFLRRKRMEWDGRPIDVLEGRKR